jgi:hypothetical protein
MTTKNNNDRKQVDYNKPVGIKDGSIYFLMRFHYFLKVESSSHYHNYI